MGFSSVAVTKEKHVGKKVNLLVSKTQAGPKKKKKEKKMETAAWGRDLNETPPFCSECPCWPWGTGGAGESCLFPVASKAAGQGPAPHEAAKPGSIAGGRGPQTPNAGVRTGLLCRQGSRCHRSDARPGSDEAAGQSAGTSGAPRWDPHPRLHLPV